MQQSLNYQVTFRSCLNSSCKAQKRKRIEVCRTFVSLEEALAFAKNTARSQGWRNLTITTLTTAPNDIPLSSKKAQCGE